MFCTSSVGVAAEEGGFCAVELCFSTGLDSFGTDCCKETFWGSLGEVGTEEAFRPGDFSPGDGDLLDGATANEAEEVVRELFRIGDGTFGLTDEGDFGERGGKS